MESSGDFDFVQKFLQHHYSSKRVMDKIELQNYLSSILKKGSQSLFLSDYEKAIRFYEECLLLIGREFYAEEHNLSELDILVIKYCLSKCYLTSKKYLDNAVNTMVQLVSISGPAFPPLYYGLARLHYEQQCYKDAENVITNGIRELLQVKQKILFQANWPSTDVQIPESNCGILYKMLKSLYTECETSLQKSTTEKNTGEEAYLSDSSLDSGELHQKDEKDDTCSEIKQESLDLHDSNTSTFTCLNNLNDNCMNDLIQNSLTDMEISNSVFGNTNEFSSNQSTIQIELCKEIKLKDKIKKSNLRADVSEFIPKSMRGVGNKLVRDKCCQTTTPKTKNKNDQTIIKSVNVFTQTTEDKNDKNNQAQETCLALNITMQKMLDKELLHQKIDSLQEELLNTKQQLYETQQKCLNNENEQDKNFIKVQFQVEQLQKLIVELENKNEEQQKINQILQALLIQQTSKFASIQQQQLSNYFNKCHLMVTDLTNIEQYLNITSIPTRSECQKQLEYWKAHLASTAQCLQLIEHFNKFTLGGLCKEKLNKFPEMPDVSILTKELKNILHESYLCIVTIHSRDKQYKYTQNFYTVNSSQLSVSAAPVMYYNQQEIPDSESTEEKSLQFASFKIKDLSIVKQNEVIRELNGKIKNKFEENSNASVNSTNAVKTVNEKPASESDHQLNNDLNCSKPYDTENELYLKNKKLLSEDPSMSSYSDFKTTQLSQAHKTEHGDEVHNRCKNSDDTTSVKKYKVSQQHQEVNNLSSAVKAMGGPKFLTLFLYIRNRIPESSEEELLKAIKKVKEHRLKLTGMTRESIVSEVLIQLDNLTNINSETTLNGSKPNKKEYENGQMNNNSDHCVICLERFNNSPRMFLHCNHSFHTDCIRQWFSSNLVCPICQMCSITDGDYSIVQ